MVSSDTTDVYDAQQVCYFFSLIFIAVFEIETVMPPFCITFVIVAATVLQLSGLKRYLMGTLFIFQITLKNNSIIYFKGTFEIS